MLYRLTKQQVHAIQLALGNTYMDHESDDPWRAGEAASMALMEPWPEFTMPQIEALIDAANEGEADMDARDGEREGDDPPTLSRGITKLFQIRSRMRKGK